MSEDWLVTSPCAITDEDLMWGLRPLSHPVSLRADDHGVGTVVVDAHDVAVVWIGASQPVHPSSHWTEVVRPANPHALDSRLDAGSIAEAIAGAVGGSTQCLSKVQGAESATGTAERPGRGSSWKDLPAADLPCDVLTESCAIFLQTRPTLALTSWIARAMDWARAGGLVPVFVTPGTVHLSPVMHQLASRGGCLWIRQGEEGMHNGVTGRAVVWDGTEFVASQAAPWPTSTSNRWDVVIDSERLRRRSSAAHVGELVEAVHDACALQRPCAWGVCEPADLQWNSTQVGDRSRAAFPAPSGFVFRSASGGGLATVVPQPIGIHEQVTCVVRADHLMPRATDLVRLGERLLQGGSDLCVLGYRQSTLPQQGEARCAGNVLPGVIGFVPARFGGFEATGLGWDPTARREVPGVEVSVTGYGVVVAFGGPRHATDDTSAALIAAWERTLAALAEHDSVRSALSAYGQGRGGDRG